MSTTSIYGLIKNEKLFYVGKTTNPSRRLSEHKTIYGLDIDLVVLDEVNSLNKEDWMSVEQYWIARTKIFNTLSNKNKGGSGVSKMNPVSLRKKAINNPRRKEITQYTINGDIIAHFESTSEASRQLNIPQSNILKAIEEKWRCRGFMFNYKGETFVPYSNKNKGKSKSNTLGKKWTWKNKK